jgi:hypothetical protein
VASFGLCLSCLLQDVYGQFHGWVQVNNQPPLLGQVALACNVITGAYDNTLTPHKALQAVADVSYYFRSNGSSNWCYSFNSNYSMIVGDPDATLRAYSYQVRRCVAVCFICNARCLLLHVPCMSAELASQQFEQQELHLNFC